MNTEYSKNKILAQRIESLIQQDPGSRGLEDWATRGTILPLAESLLKGKDVLLTSGFYILSAGAIETDGPPGASILAGAIEKTGRSVTILTDDHAEDIMKASNDAVECKAAVATLACGEKIKPDAFLKNQISHFIALERPGRAEDGFHHNFRGINISEYVAPVDDLYLDAASRGIVTIAIGDGGNELGMGNVRENVDKYISPDRPFSCTIESDLCMCAGVSNWAGYAAAAMLSRLTGDNLMPEPAALTAMLKNITGAGAVDGVSGKNDPTVDGLDPEWEMKIYTEMYKIASDKEYIPEEL